jgi:phosphopantothenoylcysteine decarboxylase/phosphopantothenate--cysteine ligase
MSEPATIFEHAVELLDRGSLTGRRVLVSAGGTREPIDSVRFVGNRSSGRMGVALAAEARRRGAEVTLLAANLAVPAPQGVELVETPSVVDLAREAASRVDFDIVVMAAAPADYAPAEPRADKRPKDGEPWTIELLPTPDVLAELGARRRNGQILVAFGADHGADGLARKRGMLDSKDVDLVVYNDVGRDGIGFDSPENAVTIVSRAGEREVEQAPKERIASEILDEVERLLR